MAAKIRRGNNIYVAYHVKDQTRTTPRVLDPDGAVTIIIRAPDASVVVNGAEMTRVAKGQFSVQWQSLLNSLVGDYTGEVTVLHAGSTAKSFPEVLFTLSDQL